MAEPRSGLGTSTKMLWCAAAVGLVVAVLVVTQLLPRSSDKQTVRVPDDQKREEPSTGLVANRTVLHGASSAGNPAGQTRERPDEPEDKPTNEAVADPSGSLMGNKRIATSTGESPADPVTAGPPVEVESAESDDVDSKGLTGPEVVAEDVPEEDPEQPPLPVKVSETEQERAPVKQATAKKPEPEYDKEDLGEVPLERPVLTAEELAALERMRRRQEQLEAEKRAAEERMRAQLEAARAEREEEGDRQWKEAAALLSSGRRDEALKRARQICFEYPRTKAAKRAQEALRQATAQDAEKKPRDPEPLPPSGKTRIIDMREIAEKEEKAKNTTDTVPDATNIATQKNDEKAEKTLRLARTTLASGSRDAARQQCREILDNYPHTEAASGAAQLLVRMGKEDRERAAQESQQRITESRRRPQELEEPTEPLVSRGSDRVIDMRQFEQGRDEGRKASVGTSTGTVKVPEAPQSSGRQDEEEAEEKLQLARTMLADGARDTAKQRCRDILKQYPHTDAASQAGKLLASIGREERQQAADEAKQRVEEARRRTEQQEQSQEGPLVTRGPSGVIDMREVERAEESVKSEPKKVTAPPLTYAKSPPFVPKVSDSESEGEARKTLELANSLLADGHREKVKEQCRKILKQYPHTEAASAAGNLLASLGQEERRRAAEEARLRVEQARGSAGERDGSRRDPIAARGPSRVIDMRDLERGHTGQKMGSRVKQTPASTYAGNAGNQQKEQQAQKTFELAETLLASGARETAQQHCRKILKSYPHTKAASKAGQLLARLGQEDRQRATQESQRRVEEARQKATQEQDPVVSRGPTRVIDIQKMEEDRRRAPLASEKREVPRPHSPPQPAQDLRAKEAAREARRAEYQAEKAQAKARGDAAKKRLADRQPPSPSAARDVREDPETLRRAQEKLRQQRAYDARKAKYDAAAKRKAEEAAHRATAEQGRYEYEP